MDFKDVVTVPADPEGKRQHTVEALNTIDTGTSILLSAHVRADFTAETALDAVMATLRAHGLPDALTFDRDTRFVGAATGRDFPSPLVRLLACLGVEIVICPPHRPDRNGFIERYHGTYERECVRVHRPATLEQAREVTAAFVRHYNDERPNQAPSCANHPPHVAFPVLPARPQLPDRVDPDGWLRLVDGRRYVRKVRHNGMVVLAGNRYYVGEKLAGQYVVLQVGAAERGVVVHHQQHVIKQLPLRGLHGETLGLDEYVELAKQDARSVKAAGRRSVGRPPQAA
jgi:hypothetical protein